MSGPAVGGAIIAACHRAWPVYLLDALAALAFRVCLVHTAAPRDSRASRRRSKLLPPDWPSWGAEDDSCRHSSGHVRRSAGRRDDALPIYARTSCTWGRRVRPAGGAPAVGALVMATVVAHSPPSAAPGALLLAVAGFSAATIVRAVVRSGCRLRCCFFDNISVVIRHTLVQVRTGRAGDGVRCQWRLHRVVERTRGVRVRAGGAVLRAGRFRCRGRPRHNRGGRRCGRVVAGDQGAGLTCRSATAGRVRKLSTSYAAGCARGFFVDMSTL